MVDLKKRAEVLDANDELRDFRKKFHFPQIRDQMIYLNGNSLGLQPKIARTFIQDHLDDWAKYGVEGHFKESDPWLTYHELLTPSLMTLVGAKSHEVVVMNTLTANLHLMMVSFYRPTKKRFKILVEYSPFPSDRYAVKSQIRYHGYNPEEALIELNPAHGEIVSNDEIRSTIEKHSDELALILVGGVNYYTGQTYDMEYIANLGQQHNITVGFDLAHAVGNVPLELHAWGVDFAVFCTYKYLNSGPGSLGGCFVHEKHANTDLPRFEGWWGHERKTRFKMGEDFIPSYGVEAWQLSNPPILSLSSIRASLAIFDEAGLDRLVSKSKALIKFARETLEELSDKLTIITPDESLSGAQLSIRVHNHAKETHQKLNEQGVICDWREPDVIRVAFSPLYNSYTDIYLFVTILKNIFESK